MPGVRLACLLSLPLACFLADLFTLCSPRDVGVAASSSSSSAASLSRPRRHLIFPEGSNLQLVYCLTVGTYAKENDVVMGITAALAWELPSKVDTKISELLHRRSRSVVFPKIEALLQSIGLDGRGCVMRALCEAAQRDPTELGKGSLIQELLHAIFTLPRDGGRFERSEDQAYEHAYRSRESCELLYPSCRHSIYRLEF